VITATQRHANCQNLHQGEKIHCSKRESSSITKFP
jgi:hypothetical protein